MVTKQDIQLGKRIKRARKRRGLTQEKLAELVRVTPKYISYLEAAKYRPSLKLLYKLADKLGLKTGDLFPHSS
jgi:transcriptional regulator with XRE-family HTH domain